MGRLFWKFFFAFVVALLIASLAVGSAMGLRQKQLNQQVSNAPVQLGSQAAWQVSDAAEIAQYGGRQSLIAYLNDQLALGVPQVYAIDNNDDELLGRVLPSHQRNAIRQLFTDIPQLRSIRPITLEDGEEVLLFIPQNSLQPKEQAPLKPPKPQPLVLILWTGILGGLLFSAVLAWWFTQPIRHLRRGFNKVATGDLSTRVSPEMGNRKDELAELGFNFDVMTIKLEKLVSAQRNLLHDVSHELRSPLARMQAAIGICQQQPDKTTDVLARIERESQRIDMLIGDLLNLSRLDTLAAENDAQQYFDLSPLLEDLVDDGRYEATEKSIAIHADIDPELPMEGKPELVLRAVENVLRNAIKFTPEQGHIRLTAKLLRRSIEITISDNGPGVSEEELTKLFQPFFKGMQARKQNSSGLGLTIAERAVKAHNGSIYAAINELGGLQFAMHFPTKKNAASF
ncbi:sensor histidine kinase [Methylophaga sp. OBS3]|uniref:sensor histidine kinase n=1 Tax=Methylophaga sp. OBS3 TaxID=2991934 RepID=UPI00224F9896|nr:ATP-binding protein [Methylophaga sp. OBS3]